MFHEVHILGDDGGWNAGSARQKIAEAVGLAEQWRTLGSRARSDAAEVNLPTSAGRGGQQPKSMSKEAQLAVLASWAAAPLPAVGQAFLSATRNDDRFGSQEAFIAALDTLVRIVVDGNVYSACERRLNVLQCRYKLHRSFNADIEDNFSMHLGAGDIASVPSVDVRRIGTAMSAARLVAFMNDKQAHHAGDVVRTRPDGRQVTLQEVVDTYFGAGVDQALGRASRRFTAEGLSLRPNYSQHRESGDMDVFEKNNVHRPRADHSLKLLRHFLKFQWGDQGRYLAELLGPVIAMQCRPQAVSALELEVTVHGLRAGELHFIGAWFRRHAMLSNVSDDRVRISLRVVQIERRKKFPAASFYDVLCNIFEPLQLAAVEPEKHPDVAYLLRHLFAVTAVVSESAGDQNLWTQPRTTPHNFKGDTLPPDALFFFHIWQQVQSLNRLMRSLEARHELRKLSGEAAPPSSLAPPPFRTIGFRIHAQTKRNALIHTLAALLLGDVLINPTFLAACCPVAYLFYLVQVPCTLSVSDTLNLTRARDQEYPTFGSEGADAGTSFGVITNNSSTAAPHAYKFLLMVGVRVFAVSMDPLHFHLSDEPLHEAYVGLSKTLHLSSADTTEMLRTSVTAMRPVPSLSELLLQRSCQAGALIPADLSQIPTCRLRFRELCLAHEQLVLLSSAVGPMKLPPSYDEGHVQFPRLNVQGRQQLSGSGGNAAKAIAAAMALREKYSALRSGTPAPRFPNAAPTRTSVGTTTYIPKMTSGVMDVIGSPLAMPSWDEYRQDYQRLVAITHDQQEVNSFCSRRLSTLEHKFLLHQALVQHETDQVDDLRELGDVYSCTKVDVHCHMASGITSRDLLEFIQEKVEKYPDDVVGIDQTSGEPVTLRRFFQTLQTERFGKIGNLVDLSVAALDVQADRRTFNRFDQFNNKYNPLGAGELRSLFLKTDNFMEGRYFAELIQKTFAHQARDRNVFSEFRLSIYGRKRTEWSQLASWFVRHGMTHHTNMFMVQIPRIFQLYRQSNLLASFEELLVNIFAPLWEVSINPTADPLLGFFLSHITGFDTVDNESELEVHAVAHEHVPPQQWTMPHNPSYSYWLYHLWANIATLNAFRASRGLSVFSFRPHCGESGNPDHLIDAFLLVQNINHGINLTHRPVLEYLYYLSQIGLGMTPLSNNALFCRYLDNPFPRFFRRGLNVTLSTDGPLQFHHTSQPLIEEYAFAVKMWGLSSADVCEIAKNSVVQCGFSASRKREWLGPLYMLHSTAGNDVRLSHIPMVRVAFRYELYLNECKYIERRAFTELHGRAMLTPVEEDLAVMSITGATRQEIIQGLRDTSGLLLPVGPAVKAKL